jgi:ADP-dependent NAD(P)H-hydrate dehydratase / NAD(P)H-hydrate epimerase
VQRQSGEGWLWPPFSIFWNGLPQRTSPGRQFASGAMLRALAFLNSIIDRPSPSPYHPRVQPVISSDQMRRIDQLTVEQCDLPSLQLMESAARACLAEIVARFDGQTAGRKVRILCGPGNNGGDGAALGRSLASLGVETEVILFGKVEDTEGDARANFEDVRMLAAVQSGESEEPVPLSFAECASQSAWEEIAASRKTFDVIVDALFGTGLKRPLEGTFGQAVEYLNKSRQVREESGTRPFILSVDIPSGLDADQAEPIGPTVQADITVTFTAPKSANVLPPAANFNGQLVIAEIGSPSRLIDEADSKLFLIEEADARDWLIRTRYTPDS